MGLGAPLRGVSHCLRGMRVARFQAGKSPLRAATVLPLGECMQRYTLSALLTVVAMACASVPAARAAAVTLHVLVGDAPPPPAYVFDSEPEVIVVPQTRVYYVPERDFDL